MVTPAASGGRINPLVLAARRRAASATTVSVGRRLWRHGLWNQKTHQGRGQDSSVPAMTYVAAAKREVFGQAGIDSLRPSGFLVIADGANDPEWIAADLLSQAEHDVPRKAS